jgi:hypothetical protein
MNAPQIVSLGEWQVARDKLLIKEKAATRARDALAAERRRLPMVRVDKGYTFEGERGMASLLDLFEGPSPSSASCAQGSIRPRSRQAARAVLTLSTAAISHAVRQTMPHY